MPATALTRCALGGRYDEVGKAFGRARPATGFSMDLRELANLIQPFLSQRNPCPLSGGDKALGDRIEQLRQMGEVVV